MVLRIVQTIVMKHQTFVPFTVVNPLNSVVETVAAYLNRNVAIASISVETTVTNLIVSIQLGKHFDSTYFNSYFLPKQRIQINLILKYLVMPRPSFNAKISSVFLWQIDAMV